MRSRLVEAFDKSRTSLLRILILLALLLIFTGRWILEKLARRLSAGRSATQVEGRSRIQGSN